MDSISYRKWEVWINSTMFEENNEFDRYYECVITPTLMVQQTLEFLYENFRFRFDGEFKLEKINCPPKEVILGEMINQYNEMCLRIWGKFKRTDCINSVIFSILRQLNELSFRLDIMLNCNKITFVDLYKGKIFQANRRNIGRGMSFEVEERWLAKKQLLEAFSSTEEGTSRAIKAYLTGMNLLGLEDQFPGLIEAAFFQFYLGCEAVCGTHECNNVKKYIAHHVRDKSESRALQIIAHQVWQVRNTYYGHNLQQNDRRSVDYSRAVQIAKQVIVVRYLCKRLIETKRLAEEVLIREIGFYANGYSENFRGDVNQLDREFFVPFNGRNVKIYGEESNNPIEYYMIPSK